MSDKPDISLPSVPLVDPLMEFRLEIAENHIKDLTAQNKELEKAIRENRTYYDRRIQEIKDQSEILERSRLKWGISTLGTLVSLLFGILWTYRDAMFKGSQ